MKNFARLLEACAAAPDVHVLVVGDGEDRPALERRAAAPDLAGRVHFAGYQADPAPFYRAMDLFALSSDSEQMPLCLVEAMASGLPVAATDVGDVRAMLPAEQAPFLVPIDGARHRRGPGRPDLGARPRPRGPPRPGRTQPPPGGSASPSRRCAPPTARSTPPPFRPERRAAHQNGLC